MASLLVDRAIAVAAAPNGHSLWHPVDKKPAKAMASSKDRERSHCFRLLRGIISRRMGMLAAVTVSSLSLLMLMSATRSITGTNMGTTVQVNNSSKEGIRAPMPSSGVQLRGLNESFFRLLSSRKDHHRLLQPFVSSDYPLPAGHPCQGFTLPPPPADKKRTGPRPCPVCYLPVEEATQQMPVLKSSPVPKLTYVVETTVAQRVPETEGSLFGGHPTLEDRLQSFQIQETMNIHCGFVRGSEPGAGTGFDINEDDRMEMDKCTGIVVASAIFGNYDQLQQPKNISQQSRETVCFFMFVDAETYSSLDPNEVKNGIWRVVVVENLPYTDARRNGKIPKLLLHRLFRKARFSLWIDGKLGLVVDPYQVLERFLWRNNETFAISRHYKRFDVFEEAEANKAAGKYDNSTIDAQVNLYKNEGLAPYDRLKSPFSSDVPEGCVIIREHTPITNLFTCLWFNEVDRFTSRDQLSYAIVRNKLMDRIPWWPSMFLDCERRNFVVQAYHRDLLEQRKSSMSTLPQQTNSTTKLDVELGLEIPAMNRSIAPNRTVPRSRRTRHAVSRKVSGRQRRISDARHRTGSRIGEKLA